MSQKTPNVKIKQVYEEIGKMPRAKPRSEGRRHPTRDSQTEILSRVYNPARRNNTAYYKNSRSEKTFGGFSSLQKNRTFKIQLCSEYSHSRCGRCALQLRELTRRLGPITKRLKRSQSARFKIGTIHKRNI